MQRSGLTLRPDTQEACRSSIIFGIFSSQYFDDSSASSVPKSMVHRASNEIRRDREMSGNPSVRSCRDSAIAFPA